MHRHKKVRDLLRDIISEVDKLEQKEYDDEKKRLIACDRTTEKLYEAYAIINQLKKEFEEKI